MTAPFSQKHLLGMEHLSAEEITTILDHGERFLEIADRGKPHAAETRPANPEAARQREREDLEASIEYTRKLLGL